MILKVKVLTSTASSTLVVWKMGSVYETNIFQLTLDLILEVVSETALNI